MNDPRIKKETVFRAEYSTIEEIASRVLDRDWSLVAAEELGNGSTYCLAVDGELDKYDRTIIDDFMSTGKRYPDGSAVMNYLCSQNELEPGDYVISVSW